MNILIDECVPHPIIKFFHEHTVHTTQEMGWDGILNGDLIARAEESFDLFITSDRNIRYQQNLSSRRIAILTLSTNDWQTIKEARDKLIIAVENMAVNSFVELQLP
jgi:hypothetical protein